MEPRNLPGVTPVPLFEDVCRSVLKRNEGAYISCISVQADGWRTWRRRMGRSGRLHPHKCPADEGRGSDPAAPSVVHSAKYALRAHWDAGKCFMSLGGGQP